MAVVELGAYTKIRIKYAPAPNDMSLLSFCNKLQNGIFFKLDSFGDDDDEYGGEWVMRYNVVFQSICICMMPF